eukprot:TRINITY_DN2633_c0_g1_i3.p1 TRINITY_DN2633_c0_g1~~TRINITY_DN2633_c0_g1_i3.p1  ORF type:complete len:488 (+),score=137.38 TRINITY_DN2633_c0_g1_i3:233-1696(+)
MMLTVMWYMGCTLALAIAVVLYKVWDTDRKRTAEVAGMPLPLPHEFFFGLVRSILNLSKTEGSLYEFLLTASQRVDFKVWCWTAPTRVTYVLSDPEDLKHVFHKNAEYYTHGSRKVRFQDLLGDGIFNSDGTVWKEQRRIASHMFTKKQLDGMSHVFDKNTKKVLALIKEQAGTSIDIQRMMFCYTFDSINEIAFGRFVASLEGDEEALKFQNAFDSAQRVINLRFVNPFWNLQRKLGLGPEKELNTHLQFIDTILDKVLTEKLANKEVIENDLVAMHIQKCEADNIPYTRKELKDVILNNMIAGRDTTGSVATSMMYELSKSPDALARIQQEVTEHDNDVDSMQFLQAVFQETLRLHPSVPLDAKTSTREDVLPSGTKIPKGVQVAFHPYLFNRNPKIYEDPLAFKPGRWMKEGVCLPYDQWQYPAFNLGPRICLGRHMAAKEAKTVIAAVVSEFKFTLDEEPKHAFQPVLQYLHGVKMTFTSIEA